MKTIIVDGVEYAPINKPAEGQDGMPYVIIRTYSAGVFAGYLESRNGQEVVLKNARRLGYWSGAFTLSEISQTGVAKPDECKFSCEMSRVELLQAIEVIEVSAEAKKSIQSVKNYEV